MNELDKYLIPDIQDIVNEYMMISKKKVKENYNQVLIELVIRFYQLDLKGLTIGLNIIHLLMCDICNSIYCDCHSFIID